MSEANLSVGRMIKTYDRPDILILELVGEGILCESGNESVGEESGEW